MIEATEKDIGRRVVYDCRPILKVREKGVIVGIEGRNILVLFDGADKPLRIFSNLRWAE